MRKLIYTAFLMSFWVATAQEIPQPDWEELSKTKPWEATELYKEVPVVVPGKSNSAPSDAIVLFDGKSLDNWRTAQFGFPVSMEGFQVMIPQQSVDYESNPAPWLVKEEALEVKPGSGAIATRQGFGNVQLHIEWKAPKMPADKTGQQGGNSGVFFMGMYEVQILNSYENPTYSNGQAASVYKQHIPLANASLPPESWQMYDIIFMAPQFSDKGTLLRPATITVFHNGVLVQNNVELLGPTCYIGTPYYVPHGDKLPIILQDHGDPMQFRNIWVREL